LAAEAEEAEAVRVRDDAWGEEGVAGPAIVVDGEISEHLKVDDVGEVGRGGVDGGQLAGDLDGGFGAADGQVGVDVGELADLDDDVGGPVRLEARGLDCDGVAAGLEVDDAEEAGGVGCGGLLGVGAVGVDGDGGARDDGAALILDGASDGSIDRGLGESCRAGGEEEGDGQPVTEGWVRHRWRS